MTPALKQENLPNELDRALLAYFRKVKGKWVDRDEAMKECGFDSPKEQPVGAYVQFANSRLRINREIADQSLVIIMDEEELGFFCLVDPATYGVSE